MPLIPLLIGALICGLIYFLIQRAPVIGEPFKQIALWVLLVIFVLWAINLVFPGWTHYGVR